MFNIIWSLFKKNKNMSFWWQVIIRLMEKYSLSNIRCLPVLVIAQYYIIALTIIIMHGFVPAIGWRPIQVYAVFHPLTTGIAPADPYDPKLERSRKRKWMDGWFHLIFLDSVIPLTTRWRHRGGLSCRLAVTQYSGTSVYCVFLHLYLLYSGIIYLL